MDDSWTWIRSLKMFSKVVQKQCEDAKSKFSRRFTKPNLFLTNKGRIGGARVTFKPLMVLELCWWAFCFTVLEISRYPLMYYQISVSNPHSVVKATLKCFI
jgi:hypothetical protein